MSHLDISQSSMIDVPIFTQPDDETCGPTSLHAVYCYFGKTLELDTILHDVERISTGGTIAALLGKHALLNGYKADLYVYNLTLFDPSWFQIRGNKQTILLAKLQEQLHYKKSKLIQEITGAYTHFLELGGVIHYKDLTINLLKKYFDARLPIITGLSATYLYNCMREFFNESGQSQYDDMRGEPSGHFVVLCGYDETKRHIVVADPHRENPISHNNYYKVNSSRLINAIMLGVLTYDANLLIIQPDKN